MLEKWTRVGHSSNAPFFPPFCEPFCLWFFRYLHLITVFGKSELFSFKEPEGLKVILPTISSIWTSTFISQGYQCLYQNRYLKVVEQRESESGLQYFAQKYFPNFKEIVDEIFELLPLLCKNFQNQRTSFSKWHLYLPKNVQIVRKSLRQRNLLANEVYVQCNFSTRSFIVKASCNLCGFS